MFAMTAPSPMISTWRRGARPSVLVLAALASAGCETIEPPTAGRAEDAAAECYSLAQVPALGIVAEDSQSFVDLDEAGRVLLDAIPGEYEHSIGQSMQTAFLWSGGEPQAIAIEGFLQTAALDMNGRGEALVLASRSGGASPEWTDAVVWKDGAAMAQIPAPAGRAFQYGRINDLGHVALSTESVAAEDEDESLPPHAFMWKDGELVDLGPGEVRALNEADEIGGYDRVAGAVVKWRAGQRTELPTTCDSQRPWMVEPVLLDEHGRIAATIVCEEGERSVLWDMNEAHELPTLAGDAFHLMDMNDRGELVGYVYVEEDENFVPVLWRGGELVPLLPEDATSGLAGSINNQGVLVGEFDGGFFVGTAAGTKALPLEAEWEWQRVGRINERGDIVGTIGGEHGYGETTLLWRPTACEDA